MPFDGNELDFSPIEVTVLLHARAGIASSWIQGAMRNTEGGRCAVGWIFKAARLHKPDDELVLSRRVISEYLFRALPPSCQRKPRQPVVSVDLFRQTMVMRYNDRQGRSRRRMIQLFDDAIKLAQAAEAQ